MAREQPPVEVGQLPWEGSTLYAWGNERLHGF